MNKLDELDMVDLQKIVEKKQLYDAFEKTERLKSLEEQLLGSANKANGLFLPNPVVDVDQPLDIFT